MAIPIRRRRAGRRRRPLQPLPTARRRDGASEFAIRISGLFHAHRDAYSAAVAQVAGGHPQPLPQLAVGWPFPNLPFAFQGCSTHIAMPIPPPSRRSPEATPTTTSLQPGGGMVRICHSHFRAVPRTSLCPSRRRRAGRRRRPLQPLPYSPAAGWRFRIAIRISGLFHAHRYAHPAAVAQVAGGDPYNHFPTARRRDGASNLPFAFQGCSTHIAMPIPPPSRRSPEATPTTTSLQPDGGMALPNLPFAFQGCSTHIAMPIPPPMHSVARPFFAFRRFISCSRVTRIRAPEAPIGWPMAMAPPFTLTLAMSRPSSLATASA